MFTQTNKQTNKVCFANFEQIYGRRNYLETQIKSQIISLPRKEEGI